MATINPQRYLVPLREKAMPRLGEQDALSTVTFMLNGVTSQIATLVNNTDLRERQNH